jgi:uncharacterized phage protein (TIGR02218 family)
MKQATPELIAYLATATAFRMCDLFTFTLSNGFVARYCDKEISVFLPGVGEAFTTRVSPVRGGISVRGGSDETGTFYDGSSIIISRSSTRTVIGVEVDTMQIKIAAAPTHLLNGTPWLKAMRDGALDGAVVQVDRCFMPEWGDTSLGIVNIFYGRVADIETGRLDGTINVNSMLELLNIQMPRNLYQPSCRNTLFDVGCTNNNTTNPKSSRKSSSTVGAGSTRNVINCALNNPADWFTGGTVTFTSGLNIGLSYTVKSWQPGVATLVLTLLQVNAVGDAFDIFWGCDRTQATCNTKFSNLDNFRGEPYVPSPELAV